jgi:DNA-binding response OmpR family regulator
MKRVLIIDDDETILNNLEESFTENQIETIKCIDRAEALAAINNDIPFDAIILDWYFVLVNDSGISKEVLRILNKKHFRPVFIYTGHLQDFENTNQEELEFPDNLISAYDKTIGVDELRNRIQQLLTDNYSLQLASLYRENFGQQLEKVLFELNELQNIDLARVLNKIYGDGSNIDWSNDFILNLLHRSLISDANFIQGITGILKAANNVNAGSNAEDRRKIANKILYFRSKSDFIRNGDIVSLKKSDNTLISYGIVITPDCDLEQKKTRLLDVVELSTIDDAKLALNQGQKDSIKKYNHDSFFPFTAINIDGILTDFIAILKSRFILKERDIAANTKYPSASKRLLYSQTFVANGIDVRLELLCTKVNPYKAEFLQKLHTNNSRVGIPDIKDLL